jgi:hypothetical protein
MRNLTKCLKRFSGAARNHSPISGVPQIAAPISSFFTLHRTPFLDSFGVADHPGVCLPSVATTRDNVMRPSVSGNDQTTRAFVKEEENGGRQG